MRILFATDGSESATGARAFLEQLAPGVETKLHVVSVIPVWIDPDAEFYVEWTAIAREERPGAEQAVQEVVGALAGKAGEITGSIREGDPAAEIISAAAEWNADLVVVGARGRSSAGTSSPGGVARNVARHCGRAALVARAPRKCLAEVVVTTDGSRHAQHAAALACRLPIPAVTRFTVIYVVRPYQGFPLSPDPAAQRGPETILMKRRWQADTIIAEATGTLARAGHHVSTEIREGDPADEIRDLVEEQGADLVVAGARGTSLIRGLVMGSVADRLLTETRGSILIVP